MSHLRCPWAVIACWLILSITAASQQRTAPTAQAAPSRTEAPEAADQNAAILAPGQFYDKGLDIHFNFPVEMEVGNMVAKMEVGHQAIFGVAGDKDPEHNEAKRCMHPLLDAELPEGKAPHRRPSLAPLLPDTPNGSGTASPIHAEILVTEFVRDCLPKEMRNKDDDVLFSLAATPSSGLGMTAITKPLWYEVGKQKIHMNAGVGRMAANGRAITEPLIIMSMATQWSGHLLVWMFISNDTEIFNEITKSEVQFGDGVPAPMFPANIVPEGFGAPVVILPK